MEKIVKKRYCVFANYRQEDKEKLMDWIEWAFKNGDETEEVRKQLLTELTDLDPELNDLESIKMSFIVQAKEKQPNFTEKLPDKWSGLKNGAETRYVYHQCLQTSSSEQF